MKIKLNWGGAIVIVMALFMIFILQYVYRTITMDEYDHHLVSEDYYKDELFYQKEIDKIKNANELPQNLKVENTTEGLTLIFPESMEPTSISGKVYLQRPSDERIDFEKELNLTENKLVIKDERLVRGKWNVKVDWKYNKEEYMLKESIFY
ncbi:MAG: FixH family protein [Flavobacteriaceae bacterium]|nr:FixH family protein [Flavobacteriaceae bacterium]